MDYVQRMQSNNGQVEGSVFDIGSIIHVVSAVSHLATQISAIIHNIKAGGVTEAGLAEKRSEIEAIVKMLSVAIAGI